MVKKSQCSSAACESGTLYDEELSHQSIQDGGMEEWAHFPVWVALKRNRGGCTITRDRSVCAWARLFGGSKYY